MRKLALVVVAAVLLNTGAGCGGPFYLSNGAGDWYNQQYGESPWLVGNVVSVAIYHWVYYLLQVVDGVFVNTYYFWFKDAWPAGDDKGTVYEHKNPSSGKKLPK